MTNLCLLGASGSIGSQTLDVVKKHPDDFTVVAISIGHQTRKIASILKHFVSIRCICLQDPHQISYYQKHYPNITFFSGDDGLLQLIRESHADMVVNALVGFVGLAPTLSALENNKIVALANKESLVVGGELITDLLSRGCGKLIPIDSEHVALAKCLSVDSSHVDSLILTASGGAFRQLTREQLMDVKARDALKHPTWKMGPKITIDCATMANKAFEVIEAHYLFGYDYHRIQIVLHDESYVHSMVKYQNGTYRLDVGRPDMRVPIAYALYQGIIPFKTVICDDYHELKSYHFHDFSLDRYPLVSLAEVVINKKGTYGAVFNAANEVAVRAYLKGEISFIEIEKVVFALMKEHHNILHPTYQDIVQVDTITRQKAIEFLKR